MNAAQFLLNFADKIEQKEIVNQSTAIKIRGYIRRIEDSTMIELFLIVSGIMGALFCVAGIFSIVGEYWDTFPTHVRGIFSVVPVLVGLYFYYRAIFHHPKSRSWTETSSVFLMLMIGASLALLGNTYQLDSDGDLNTFFISWAVLSLPLFYFSRASGITIIYFGLITQLAVKISIGLFYIPSFIENNVGMWYWILLIGFLPHYYLALNKNSRKQGVRVVYMSYVIYISFVLVMTQTFKGSYILWVTTSSVAFYLLGKRFMGENKNIFNRPFQLFSQLWIAWLLVSVSSKISMKVAFMEDSFFLLFMKQEGTAVLKGVGNDLASDKIFYFIAVLIVLAMIYAAYFYFRKHLKDVSKLIVFTPTFVVLMMILHEYAAPDWLILLLINAYVLFIGFNTMIKGSENRNMLQMIFGFGLVSVLLWLRYFDTDWNFVLKGLTFLGIGGIFFLINLTQKSKLERIERNKTRRDDY
ncbi:MAG: DUF2157 domain-containing protein [Crocinitomicaceae bacterium]